MRANTAWIPDSVGDLIAFAKMNSLGRFRLALDDALIAFEKDEAKIEAR